MFQTKKINYVLAALPVLIFALGFMLHLSTSKSRATTHFIFFALSYFLFWVFSFIDYKLLSYVFERFYKLTLILLVLVFIVGKTVLGSTRWLSFGFLNFQPSVLAQFSLILFLGFYLNKFPKTLSEPKALLKLVSYTLPLFLLVFIQPDLGSTLVLLFIFIGMLYAYKLHWTYFVVALCLAGALSAPIWGYLHDYQKQRVLVFLNPDLDTLGRGYNVLQSMISIGSGGFWGKGFGRGSQSHYNFLPIFWTDFVVAAFSEEWGFIGFFTLTLLYGGLLYSLLYISEHTANQLGKSLSFGVFCAFLVHFVVNVGMNLGLLPVTGIPLPLVSYGGTSMLVSCVMLGVCHSVWINES